jgi:hypothetical protein
MVGGPSQIDMFDPNAGRDFRLTDVYGNVVKEILA